MSNNPKTLL
jgi:hypothetical protein